ncbi:CHAT domain-containing protein [Ephemerocybe angulata]|uniref:CHAT domain-containing protein n=1 Tax=Ephemerocybe angulata TaxID=980116 RepID=A0A8H6HK35_9AGAR|nr:CHAT domain-containing protein [Tulosesus angulatus]
MEQESSSFAQLNNCGIERLRTFKQTGDLSELAEGISMLQQAVNLTPHGHADLPSCLNNLGASFQARYERTGELSDVLYAIAVQQKSVDLTPHGHADLPAHLNNLGYSLARRFERIGELSDIADAISAQQKAVDLTPHDHAHLPAWLNNLGSSFTHRFECTGEVSDIENAISVGQKALDLTPDSDTNLRNCLTNLGISFKCRYKRTGELSDIASSISMLQQALDLTPHGHPYLPMLLNNLGSSFECRYERTNELSDIADAISVQQKGVDLIPDGHAELPTLVNNLGSSFRCRFERTGELSDIANAISALQRAVDLTPHGHTGLPGRLNNLGTCFARRFQRTGEISDIGEAISAHQKAVDLTPHGHTDLAGLLNSLGTSFQFRYERTGELSDIAYAISMQQKAVDLTPHSHASHPAQLINLANSLHSCAISNRNTVDLEKCLSLYKTAAISIVGPPQDKLEAATRRARALIKHFPQSPDIITSFETALGQVALIAGLEQTVRGRYTQLERISNIPLEAAAAACALGRADKALEWLEQGRCLVWTQQNNLRTPLDDLRGHNKDLAQDISNVSKQLENAGSSRSQSNVDMPMSEKISLENEARAHLGLARKWEDLLKTARAIPGFGSFLKPLSCSSLMRGVPESAVVVINIADRRCDALALLPGLDKPLHIPLPAFSFKKASEYRNVLASQLREHHLRAREEQENLLRDVQFSARGVRPAPVGRGVENAPVCRVLRNLWYEVVKPILDGLGFQHMHQTGGQLPPRLWWCPTGPLSFLPLHAAGIYRGSNRESVSDYVVSSYTPTVTAVTDRAKNRLSVDVRASGLFLTSQPNVPGASPIPGTTSEVRAILKRAEESGVRVVKCEGEELTVDACLMRMQDYSSIHLACHGSQNATEPLRSRFLFHRGSLELGRIIRSDLKNADLAFLSACQTSAGEEKLSDEAIHLTAGMLAAGYRRVIGTMWSIGDKPAQDVAINFYDYLLTPLNGARNGGFDGALSAFALDHATRRLRLSLDDSEHSLLTWIPFVHFGY